MLTLYDYFRSSASFRVRIALNLKGLDYDMVPVHLVKDGGMQHSEQYKALNPQELVPTLVDDKHVLTQSLAIIEYLNETHPAPALLPNTPLERAWVRALALSIAADIHPLNNLRVLNFIAEHNIAAKETWYQHWVTLGLSALEKQVSTSPYTKSYCFGDTPTLADICLVPQMYNARRFACDVSAYPTLVRIDHHCQQHPAFLKAWPKEE